MEELDLKDLLDLFLSKIWQMILIVVVAGGIGILYTLGFVTPKYSSYTTFALISTDNKSTQETTDSAITATDITINSKLVQTYRVLIESSKVLRQVISNLGIDITEEELKEGISVSTEKDTDVIRLTVTNENAVDASRIANEIVKVFSEMVPEMYNINNVYVVDEAEVESEPSNIHHTKDVILFTFVGGIIAIGYALISNMLDTTIKTAEEVEKEFNLPVLVSVPFIDNFNNLKGGKNK